MREAAVGHQCPECVREGARSVRQARTAFGGRITTVPLVTYVLIGLNVLAYIGELVRPAVVDRFEMLGAGMRGPDGGHYVWQAALPAGFHAEGVIDGEWYRLLTGAFLHLPPTEGTFGLLHIVMNMVSLWNIGRVVEAQLGRLRYVVLYLLSALGGSVLVLLIAPTEPTLGASGAIFGLGAAYYVMARRLGADMAQVNRFMAGLMLWLVMSAWLTSWEAHLGGLLAGAAVTLAYAYAPRDGRRALVQAGACAVLLVVLLVSAWAKVTELTGVQ
jgi:membrane associated rhomboid family serine protease